MPLLVTVVAARLFVHGSAAWFGRQSQTVLDSRGRLAAPAAGTNKVSTPAVTAPARDAAPILRAARVPTATVSLSLGFTSTFATFARSA